MVTLGAGKGRHQRLGERSHPARVPVQLGYHRREAAYPKVGRHRATWSAGARLQKTGTGGFCRRRRGPLRHCHGLDCRFTKDPSRSWTFIVTSRMVLAVQSKVRR
jgi:hypothetical protein